MILLWPQTFVTSWAVNHVYLSAQATLATIFLTEDHQYWQKLGIYLLSELCFLTFQNEGNYFHVYNGVTLASVGIWIYLGICLYKGEKIQTFQVGIKVWSSVEFSLFKLVLIWILICRNLVKN